MASKNFPRKVNTQKVINTILKQSIFFDHSEWSESEFFNMTAWCRENVGYQNSDHPINICREGNMQLYEGQWAWSFIDGKLNFWFAYRKDKMSFALTFK